MIKEIRKMSFNMYGQHQILHHFWYPLFHVDFEYFFLWQWYFDYFKNLNERLFEPYFHDWFLSTVVLCSCWRDHVCCPLISPHHFHLRSLPTHREWIYVSVNCYLTSVDYSSFAERASFTLLISHWYAAFRTTGLNNEREISYLILN